MEIMPMPVLTENHDGLKFIITDFRQCPGTECSAAEVMPDIIDTKDGRLPPQTLTEQGNRH